MISKNVKEAREILIKLRAITMSDIKDAAMKLDRSNTDGFWCSGEGLAILLHLLKIKSSDFYAEDLCRVVNHNCKDCIYAYNLKVPENLLLREFNLLYAPHAALSFKLERASNSDELYEAIQSIADEISSLLQKIEKDNEKKLINIFTSALLENAYIGNLFRIIDIKKVNGTDNYYYIQFDYSDNTYDLFRFKIESIRNNFFKSYSEHFETFKLNSQRRNGCFHNQIINEK